MKLAPQAIEDPWVRLEPFSPNLREEVRVALDVDPAAWRQLTLDGRGEAFDGWWEGALAEAATGSRIPFAIRRKADGRVVGTTSLLSIRPGHRGCEIGATFLHPEARGGAVNPAAKRLLLAHAFDAGALRVELITDLVNAHSQAAIAKLGAVREGVLRSHRITWTGRVRDTVIFSITDKEWPLVRDGLEARLEAGGRRPAS